MSKRNKILTDLFHAYFDARRNKRSTLNVLAFEKYFESNIFELTDEILENSYKIKPSICFIVKNPVKREIFAADFRDRVVHHFIYNNISPLFEKVFINDSYSCRAGKGTHYGINRVDHFMRSCSQNYSKEAYILKLDIKGYFMSMNKLLLYKKTVETIFRFKNKINFDLPLVLNLIEKTIFNDPRKNCIIKGKHSDWKGLPKSKSLFHTDENCGLPIGNLTSQLFGNIYMNDFDHYIKRDLEIRYYGRYVDDFILVHKSKDYLKSLISEIAKYLQAELKLTLHPDKIYLQDIEKGVKYIGAVIKPHRKYISNRTKGNFYETVEKHNGIASDHRPSKEEQKAFINSMNSYIGIMKHYKTFKERKKMVNKKISAWWWNYFYVSEYVKLMYKTKNSKIENL